MDEKIDRKLYDLHWEIQNCKNHIKRINEKILYIEKNEILNSLTQSDMRKIARNFKQEIKNMMLEVMDDVLKQADGEEYFPQDDLNDEISPIKKISDLTPEIEKELQKRKAKERT